MKLCVIYFVAALYCNGHAVIVFPNPAQMWARMEVNRPKSRCKKRTLHRTVQDRAGPVLQWPGLPKYLAGKFERCQDLLNPSQPGRCCTVPRTHQPRTCPYRPEICHTLRGWLLSAVRDHEIKEGTETVPLAQLVRGNQGEEANSKICEYF